ncbi:MAG TPA: TonB-dependent receptor [Gammaproteobacteria bacterium]|nr:TonB-dependent receptor [Gammaproteobacteria bacterium]
MKTFINRRCALSALVLSSALGLAAPAAFAAQNGAADQNCPQGQAKCKDQATQLGTISVTGTHIRAADVETAQPVIVIGRDQIEHEGFTNVAEILQNLTVAGSPPISRSNVLLSGEAVGGYYVDLRNLGAARTLILLNGKRLGTDTGGLQDLEQIPVSAIQRIEVLKAGAAAVYGSDAIAGVVNIITRNHFTGAQASAYYGQYSEGDGTKQTYSLTYGAQSDRGSIMISAEYSKENPVWGKDRWFSKYPATTRHPDAGWSIASQYGVFFNGNPFTGVPAQYGTWCGSGPITGANGLCTLNPGGNPFDLNDYHPTHLSGTADHSNTNTEMMLKTGLNRKAVFAHADYDITDHISVQTTFLYNHRETLQQIAGYPFQPAFTVPGNPNVIGLTPDSYFNPFGTGPRGNGAGDTLWFYRRGWEVPRTTDSQLTTYRIGSSLVGDFTIGEHLWNWDVGAYTNQNNVLKIGHGDFNLIATSEALGPSFLDPSTGKVTCGTAASPIPYGSTPGSCVPWNPLYPAGQVGPGSLTGNPALQQFLFPYYHTTGATSTTDYTADITGSIVTLPAGDLSIAAGYEYRKESGKYVPDAFAQGALSTNLSSGPTQGQYNVKAYYGELNIPILSDLPGAQMLSVDLADRHSNYSSFGSTNDGKFDFQWRPIRELLIRGTYSQGFRAPQIADLFGGTSGDFAYYTDPCDISHEAGKNPAVAKRCTSGFGGQTPVPGNYVQLGQGGQPCATFPCQTGTQFFSGSSPTLQPETSTTKTAGFVYSPSWAGHLDLTVDWFRIHIDNTISGDSMDSILYDCYVLGVASRCSSSLFTRASSGVVNSGHYGETNAGWDETEGWDFGIHYQFPLTSFGLFDLTWNTTYTDYWREKADNKPDTPVNSYVGWGPTFRVRSNADLDWSMGAFGVTLRAQYYSPMKEQCSWDNTAQGGPECNMPQTVHNGVTENANEIGSNTFYDLQIRYNTPINSTIALGVNNVFDHFAEPMYTAPNSFYPYYGGFDIGRFWYLRYTQNF